MSKVPAFSSAIQPGSIQSNAIIHKSFTWSFGIIPSITASSMPSATPACTTPPNKPTSVLPCKVTFGTIIQAGRTNWLISRTANMAVWPLLCAIKLAKAWPTGPSTAPIKISGMAAVTSLPSVYNVASPALKIIFDIIFSLHEFRNNALF